MLDIKYTTIKVTEFQREFLKKKKKQTEKYLDEKFESLADFIVFCVRFFIRYMEKIQDGQENIKECR